MSSCAPKLAHDSMGAKSASCKLQSVVRKLPSYCSFLFLLFSQDIRAFTQLDLANPACSAASPCTAMPTYSDAIVNSFTTSYTTGSAVAKAQGLSAPSLLFASTLSQPDTNNFSNLCDDDDDVYYPRGRRCRYAYRSKARFHVWMQNLTSCEMACQHQDASNMTVISCTPMFPHHNDLFIGSHTTIPLCLVHVLPTRNLTLCCICL